MKKIGIIGVGGIATDKHIPELQKIPDCKITAICDVDETALRKVGDRLEIPDHLRFTDYNDLIACAKVDAVEICTPNHLHVPMALAAIAAGKPVNVEKPLSTSLDAAKPLADVMQSSSVPNMMCFSYRFMPAVRFAKYIADNGLIGDILSLSVEYSKSSAFLAGRKLEWRFIKEYAGTGVLGDLGVHLIDMAELLAGKMTEVTGVYDIIVKERPKPDGSGMGKVETDDYCSFLAKFQSGANGTFVITRCAHGQSNTIKYEICGSKGVLSFDLNHPDTLSICVGEIDILTQSVHTVKAPKQFFINQEQAFIDLLKGKKCDYFPTIEDGLAGQKVLDAILRSADEKQWISI